MEQRTRRRTKGDDTHRDQFAPVALSYGALRHNAGYTTTTATRADGLAMIRLRPQAYQKQLSSRKA